MVKGDVNILSDVEQAVEQCPLPVAGVMHLALVLKVCIDFYLHLGKVLWLT